jgi:hypothetical protein
LVPIAAEKRDRLRLLQERADAVDLAIKLARLAEAEDAQASFT